MARQHDGICYSGLGVRHQTVGAEHRSSTASAGTGDRLGLDWLAKRDRERGVTACLGKWSLARLWRRSWKYLAFRCGHSTVWVAAKVCSFAGGNVDSLDDGLGGF